MKRRTVIIVAIAWMLVVVAIASSALTMALVGSDSAARLVSEDDYEALQRYRRLEEVYDTMMNDYYVPLEEETLVTGAIRGMMESVEDPYTFYYTTEEMKQSNEQNEGIYHGVGMVVQLTEDGFIEIARVYEDSPANTAGLLAGDRIVAVDGTPVSGESGKTLNEAVQLIQGEDGTDVQLTVLRDGEELELTATRAAVNISYVDYCIIDNNIGYVNIAQFTGDDVTGFEEAVAAFKIAGVSGMVVDLRNNPGGLLTDVVKISDMLLPEGLVTYVEDRQGNRQEEKSDAKYWDIPMVVLVNGMSASASELFTAAMQDYDRATVVGTKTFGKGIVQTLITFADDGAGMQLTTASYYSPKGRSIHQTGVEPDVVVELSETYNSSIYEPDPENDNQLAAALEELEKRIAEGPWKG
ncbi:MAG: S41 family peptidase [Candidatus Faecivicinus sp.]